MAERSPGIRQSDEWVRAVEARLGVGFWSWDIANARLHCSAGLYALAGINPAGLHLDLAFLETLVHPKDRLPVDDLHGFVTDSRQTDRQFRIIRPDGQLRHLRSEARRLFDRDGNATRVVAVVSDITERQDVGERLANTRALLQNVSRLIGAILWIADEEGRLIEHFSSNDVIDTDAVPDGDVSNWRASLHPDDLERLPDHWREAVGNRKPYSFSPRLRLTNGEYQQFHIEGLPFSSEMSSSLLYGGISSSNARITAPRSTRDDLASLTPAQVRACRALLDWTAETLAQNAGISVSTVRRIESAEVPGQGDSLRLVLLAFREAGLTIWRDERGRFAVSDLA